MSTTTVIPIKSFVLNVASNKTFNEWKGNILLYRQTGTVAVDVRFVDDPDFFAQYESVDPQGCSQVYVSFSHYPIYVDILQSKNNLSVALYQGVPAGFAKMILQSWPRVSAQAMAMQLEHQIDTRSFRRSAPLTLSKTKKMKK